MIDINLLCQNVGESLKAAVIEALETKRRMGHYAVIVENGRVRRIGPEEIGELLRADNSECPNNLSQGDRM